MTPIKDITQLKTVYEDLSILVCKAYDNVKKSYCLLTLPKTETSWTHSIEY